jgi:Tfp pilus assembly PilM family ATPase
VSRFLAIDADAQGLFVAAGSLRGADGIAVEQTAAAVDDVPPLTPATAADLGARLKDLLRQAGIKAAPVLLCVGRDRIIPRDVHHPPTPPADEPAIVRFQAIRDLTESPDDVVMDYTPLGDAPAGERRALVVFVRKEVVRAARQMCEAAGLKLAAVTPRPFALAAALRHAVAAGAVPPAEDPSAALAVVSLWDRGGEFTVVRGTDITFTRSIPAPAVGGERALVAELKRNLAVYAGQHPGAPVRALYLTESDAPGVGWAGRVYDALPVPVYAFDPLAGAASAEAVPVRQRGRFAGPVGLLSLRAATTTLPINFVTPRQPRAERNPAKPRTLLAALACVAVVALLGVFAFLQLDRADRRVTELTAQRDQLDSELRRLEPNAKRVEAADEFMDREVVWLDELYDLADRVPNVGKVAVTEFDGTALPPPKKETRLAPAPGQPAAPARKPKAAPPVAQVRITYQTADAQMAQRVADAFKNDKYYVGVSRPTMGGNPTAKGQTFAVIAQVLHRKPGEYKRELQVKPPAPAERPAEGGGGGFDFGGGFGGFGGGLGGFGQ